MPAAIREGSSPMLLDCRTSPNPYFEIIIMRAEPKDTIICVRIPAVFSRVSRSKPMPAPQIIDNTILNKNSSSVSTEKIICKHLLFRFYIILHFLRICQCFYVRNQKCDMSKFGKNSTRTIVIIITNFDLFLSNIANRNHLQYFGIH